MKVRFYDIVWDTDGLHVEHLPSEIILEVAADLNVYEDGADILTGIYGFCVEEAEWELVP